MTWHLDPTHTQVEFSVRHMMISTVRGNFRVLSATADFDPADLSSEQVTAIAQAASVHTGVEQRDAHLRSPDFFDVEAHPEVKLVGRKFALNGAELSLSSEITIPGVTAPLEFRGEITGPAKDPWGQERVGVSLSAELAREAFGLTWNQALETGGCSSPRK